MARAWTILLLILMPGAWAFGAAREAPAAAVPVAAPTPAHPARVVVIPIHGEINQPIWYIVRRGLKMAVEQKADAVVLDIDTLGGEMEPALGIMQALQQYPGLTLAYVNPQAMSAGAFIAAATTEIYFAPGSVIGAAAPVTSGGGDIDQTMKEKLVSYMKGRIRAISEGKGYRGQVISAMIDADYVLEIDGKVLKPKGSLLTLTAEEASKTYGKPPRPLLAAGIAKDVPALLQAKFGPGNYTVEQLRVTWSEHLAVWLKAMTPILLGLGLVALFIEFKTPGFGIFGISGIVLLGLVFLGNYAAGLSGHEPMLFFAIGLLLLILELFVLPGTAILAVSGIILMLGSLVWSLADLWPDRPLTLSGGAFVQPLQTVGLGVGLAVVLGALVLRYLPKGWIWDKMVVRAASGVGSAGQEKVAVAEEDALVGRAGVAATALRPSGQVEIDGRIYEAIVAVGVIDAGERVRVTGRSSFALVVEKEGA